MVTFATSAWGLGRVAAIGDSSASEDATDLTAGSSHTISVTARNASGNARPTARKSVTIAGATTYTIAGNAAGTYTVTPSKSGCTFSPASLNVTVGPNAAAKHFTAPCGGGTTTPFTDGFESAGWSFGNVSGTTGYWTLGSSSTHPSASLHGGSTLAAFDSYIAASGVSKRMYQTTGFAVASRYSSVSLKLWMYHDPGCSSSADKVQAQVSTNRTTWTNVGTAFTRNAATATSAQATVDLSAYKGQTVYLATVGTSAFGNDVYLDDVTVTAQ